MALEAIGLPIMMILRLQALSANNDHYLQWAGICVFAFVAASGVRQGCPASSSIFVMVTDPIIRTLCLQVPSHIMVRAYADDTAMIIKDFWKYGPKLLYLSN